MADNQIKMYGYRDKQERKFDRMPRGIVHPFKPSSNRPVYCKIKDGGK